MTLKGDDITRLRKMMGLNITEYSRLIGVNEATYYRWIKDEFTPNTPTARFIYAVAFMYKTRMIEEFRALLDLDTENLAPLEPLKPFKTSERLAE
ncbi:MAG: helix-turn-helix transcriptional regulator [Gammaproteobacteria bacterium]|nr:helix-turn-helix transcriptional regulator [Gammaproteobacteria bacterium]